MQQDYGRMLLNYLLKCQNKRQSVSDCQSDDTLNADTPDSVTPEMFKSGAMTPDVVTPDVEDPDIAHHVLSGASNQQLSSKLRELSNQLNGTQLPLTRNELDGVEEPIDEKNEKRENWTKALCDVEVDVDQKDSEMKDDKDQKPGKELPHSETENKKLGNLESLSTNMIDYLDNENLQKTVEKQNAIEMERTDRMPEKECFDCNFKIKPELRDHTQGGFNAAEITDSKGQIITTKNKANYKSERIHIDQNAEEGKKDISENKGYIEFKMVKKQHSVKSIEPEAHSLLEGDEQKEMSVESFEESGKAKSQEETKVTEYSDVKEKDSIDYIGNEQEINEKTRLTHSQHKLDIGGEGNSGHKMIENMVKGLNVVEKKTEAHVSDVKHSISDFTAESSQKKEEIMVKQYEMTQDNKTGFQVEKINRDGQTQESDVENESSDNLVEKIEEHSRVAEAEQCDDHTLKDVLDFATSGHEEFLTPEQICKVSFGCLARVLFTN